MGSRLLNLLLCALLLGPMSLPAWAIARPENRIGKSFSDSPKTASADLDQTAGARQESRCYVYEFASGMRIYLYCQNDPVNRIDPSGHGDLISTICAGVINAGLSAMSAVSTAFASGYGEVSLFVAYVGYQEAYERGGWGDVAVQAGISLVPVGQFARVFRGFPSWMKRGEITRMSQVLVNETRQAVPSAGLRAASSGLRFSQTIKPGSIVVKGMGGAGADVQAIAIVNGVEKKLARELVAFQGDLSKNSGTALYQSLCRKAERQAANADILEIQLELTEQAMSSVQHWKEVVKEKLLSFSKEHPDVYVHVVDSAGNDIQF